METKLEQIAAKAVKQRAKGVVREIRTPRSVGTGGGRPPPVTRWAPSNGCPYRNRKLGLRRGRRLALPPLEEAGFEPAVPLYILTVSDPLLVGPVTVPFAKRRSPVGERVPSVRHLLPPPSIPGHRLGAL